MSRSLNTMPQFENYFLFFNRYETREHNWEMINAHQGIEMVYVREGEGQVILNEKMYTIVPGTLVLVQPFQLHHYKMKSHYVRMPIVFEPQVFERYFSTFPALLAFFRRIWKGQLDWQVFRLNIQEQKEFERIGLELQERLNGASVFAQQEEFGLFLIDWFRLLRKVVQRNDDTGRDTSIHREKRHIEQMMEWIEVHYQKGFSLESLARSLHISTFHASHLFREETGCTLSQYVLARRIREACFLLATTDKSITEVGRQTGFNSSAYFCKQFKKQMGLSPQSFRKRSP
ncbi:helix-turn-helix domain-containing protein [Brevibacillus sp. NRS-1366]|uniref:helix-turn-helix domain-containing protein n=1 Tax=Brevibacillus sp. NRS-1366 TaxID=3233899 RepID=UPI003D1F92E7